MVMKHKWRRFGWMAILASAAAAPVPRATVELNDHWRFDLADPQGAEASAFDDAGWQAVQLPHTWNNRDGEDGGNNYHRGAGWYRRHLPADPAWAGKRAYLRVGAASMASAVYVNGKSAGTHKGGFGAFCYDITPLLDLTGDNVVAIRVDNAKDKDIAPLSADFTFFGGLYRGVKLIVADPLAVDPTNDGGSGLAVRQDSVSADEAKLTVTTLVRNAGTTDMTATVHCDVAGVTGDATAAVPAGRTVPVEQHLVIAHPHLWNGRKDPFEYPARVTVSDGATVTDEVEDRVGLRSYRVDPDKGFFLNGQPYRLYGVNRHQDFIDKGWAVGAEDERRDAANIVDLGCTGVRLSHYQQSPSFYDLMDRAGIVVWAEIPLVNEVTATDAFADNAEQQLRELIKQNCNHPSICFWGMFNELRGGKLEASELAVARRLNGVAHQLDPTRPTTEANSQGVKDALGRITDVGGFNRYPGWYSGHMGDLGKMLDDMHATYPTTGIGLSEYGGGGAVTQHEPAPVRQPKPGGAWHPEEYQAELHESEWAAIKGRPWIWGSFLWCLHDFAADQRNEGEHAGRNDKGLVTYDGKTRKDTFYFYQANWSDKPMVYVTDRRFTPRPNAEGPVKVYSNCDEVTLTVNGQRLAAVKPNDVHVFAWPTVTLKDGENRIEASGVRGGVTVTDGCTLVVAPDTK